MQSRFLLALVGLLVTSGACSAPGYGETEEDARREAQKNDETKKTTTTTTTPPPASSATAPPPPAGPMCLVEGWLGLTLANEEIPRDACVTKCDQILVDNPKAKCTWGDEDITPLGSCVLTNAQGGKLFDGQRSKHACGKQCETLMATNPDLLCTFNGTKIWL